MRDPELDELRSRSVRRLGCGCATGMVLVVLAGLVGVAAQLDLVRASQPAPRCDRATRSQANTLLFSGGAHPSRGSDQHRWSRRDVWLLASAVRCGMVDGRPVAALDRALGGLGNDGPLGRDRLYGTGLFVAPGRILGLVEYREPTAGVELAVDRRTRRVRASSFSCDSGALVKVPSCRGIEAVQSPAWLRAVDP